MYDNLPTIACGIVLIMSGQQAGQIGVFINFNE
jgi:hypothetical protein